MKVHFVKCSNCKTINMKVPVGNKICPICGAVHCLEFINSESPTIECHESSLLSLYTHNYEPTDSQGWECVCEDCGHYDSVYSGMEFNGELMEKDLLKDYSINHTTTEELNKESIIIKNAKLDYYKDIHNVIYAELCSTGIVENLKKLYGNDAITLYTITVLSNKMLAIKAIMPKFPNVYSIVYKDDVSEEVIQSLVKCYN